MPKPKPELIKPEHSRNDVLRLALNDSDKANQRMYDEIKEYEFKIAAKEHHLEELQEQFDLNEKIIRMLTAQCEFLISGIGALAVYGGQDKGYIRRYAKLLLEGVIEQVIEDGDTERSEATTSEP